MKHKYKEFEDIDKKSEKNAWYDLILGNGVYVEYLSNIYEMIGSIENGFTWILSDINNGDTLSVTPIDLFFKDEYNFIKENTS